MVSDSDQPYDVRLIGDSALAVSFEERIAPEVNARAVVLASSLRRADLTGVRDIVESYSAVTVHFDPLAVDIDHLTAILVTEAGQAVTSMPYRQTDPSSDERVIVVPVCYDKEFGPDLPLVSKAAGCDENEVVRRHTARTYRVYMLGFLPGFAYMGSVDPIIAVARRSVPRLRVPAGSVGIAGPQTGVYPLTAPGGWQLIGRTPLMPWDLDRPDPFLFNAGDRVQFDAVTPQRFAELSAKR